MPPSPVSGPLCALGPRQQRPICLSHCRTDKSLLPGHALSLCLARTRWSPPRGAAERDGGVTRGRDALLATNATAAGACNAGRRFDDSIRPIHRGIDFISISGWTELDSSWGRRRRPLSLIDCALAPCSDVSPGLEATPLFPADPAQWARPQFTSQNQGRDLKSKYTSKQ